MVVDKRVERNTQSVIALFELLREVIDNPSAFLQQQSLVMALRSQGALARYEDKTKSIYASSINTVKRIADDAAGGGFDALDRLRKGACESLKKEAFKEISSKKGSKAELLLRVEELKTVNQTLRQDLLLLTLAFEKALRQGLGYARRADNKSVLEVCKREQRELLTILVKRNHPLITNVKKIHED